MSVTATKQYVAEQSTSVEGSVVAFARSRSAMVLRLALSLVFLWFGSLKLFDASPVTDLVAGALPFLPSRFALIAVGVLEVAVGLGLLTRRAFRLTMSLFFALLLGTFSLLVTQPALAFSSASPLHLTVTGEFIVKNLVLLAGGLTLVAGPPRERD